MPESVKVNGKQLPRQVSGSPKKAGTIRQLTTIVRIDALDVSEKVHIEIRRPTGAIQRRAQLDGFAGSIARLQSVYDAINHERTSAWSPDALIAARQTGDRSSYPPEGSKAQFDQFSCGNAEARTFVQRLLHDLQPQRLPT